MKYASKAGVTINLVFVLGRPGTELIEALFISHILDQLFKLELKLTEDRKGTVGNVMSNHKTAPTSWLYYGVSG